MTSPEGRDGSMILRVSDLPQNRATRFDLAPDPSARDGIARDLDILDVRKLAFSGSVSALGKTAWKLDGTLGATVVQACVVTLEPVVTRIDTPVTRQFVAGLDKDLDDEVEMPEDDTQEPLGPEIDLGRVMVEALALALPDYPRSDDASLESSTFAAPGVTPLTDAETKPFAGLAALKQKLEKGE